MERVSPLSPDRTNPSIESGYEPEITAFEIDLDSILNNLILNSVEAFITRDHVGTRSINIHVSQKTKSSMLISYTDSGPGIAPEIKDVRKILNFGETTKRGKNGDMDGTGIGMWILDSVVNEFGGTVQLFRPNSSWGFRIDIVLPTSPKSSSV
jgi:sensor histidine kinase regulating citrate/malate metabolism